MPEDPPEVLERFHETLELVQIVARQVARSFGQSVEVTDLESYGREGLLNAARRFDAERGVPFRAYANYRVRGAIIDGVRADARLSRRMHEKTRALQAAATTSEGTLEDLQAPSPAGSTAADADVALSSQLASMATAMAVAMATSSDASQETLASADESPEEATSKAELLELVREAVAELPDQESELVRRHYFDGERLDHVATSLGLSKSWVSRLHTRAVDRLTRRLRSVAG